jgi:hypothetical protein
MWIITICNVMTLLMMVVVIVIIDQIGVLWYDALCVVLVGIGL